MLGIFIIQLPFSVCAVWCLLVMIKRHKTTSDRLIMWVMGLLAVSAFCASHHMDPHPDFRMLAIYNVLMQFASLAVFPIICLYIRSCYEDHEITWFPYLSTIPSLLQFACSVVLTALLGIPRCAEITQMQHSSVLLSGSLTPLENAYVIIAFKVYLIVFFISLSVSLVYVFARLFTGKFKFSHIMVFLRGRKSSFVANVICLFFVIFFILWGVLVLYSSVFTYCLSTWSILWSLAASFILFMIGYVAAVPALPGGYINLERLRHPFGAMNQSTQEFLQGIDSGPMAGVASSGYDKIMESFKQYMEKDHGYLNNSLTIDEIARVLNTNRTYVSKLVNLYYGMSFRDFLNKKRLDYSKRLMSDEPDASLDYIAAKSGFQSSTQFIRKFRETEGITPTVWKQTLKNKKN